MGGQPVDLADAIEALRAALFESIQRGWNAPMHFRLSPIELTLQVEAARGADGTLGWNVLSFGGNASSTSTQTLKVTLTPVWRQGDGTTTADFTIAAEPVEQPHFGPAAHP